MCARHSTVMWRVMVWIVDAAVATIQERQAKALDDLVDRRKRMDSLSVASDFKSLWSLYHLVPAPTKTDLSYSIELCSPNGRNLVLHALLKKEVKELWDLFGSTDTKEKFGTLRGIRYEAYAHKKILVDGINGTARLLTKTAITPKQSERERRGDTCKPGMICDMFWA